VRAVARNEGGAYAGKMADTSDSLKASPPDGMVEKLQHLAEYPTYRISLALASCAKGALSFPPFMKKASLRRNLTVNLFANVTQTGHIIQSDWQ
jgi:hypothetical protein